MEVQSQQAQQASKITLTYETLFDLVVREKSRDELQTLHTSFFTDLVSYMNEKRSMLNLMSLEEKEKAAKQLQNINRLVKELYERREKKIISFALARSRAGADIVDTSPLLAQEKELFNGLVLQLDSYRDSVLNNLLAAKAPISAPLLTGAEVLATASKIIISPPASAISGTGYGTHKTEQQEATAAAAEPESVSAENKTTRLVRFLHPVPRFVGRELEVYGPFDQEDIANLPIEIVEVLITKGRAEEIVHA